MVRTFQIRNSSFLHRQLSLIVIVASLVFITFSSSVLAGAGGSRGLFTLDPDSALGTFSPADIFVDDDGFIPPDTQGDPSNLTVALPATDLGLSSTDNIDALSCGNDTAISIILANLKISNINPMNPVDDPGNPKDFVLMYQFSVTRNTVNNVQGAFNLPHNSLLNPIFVMRSKEFSDQFTANDQAADMLNNWGLAVGVGVRINVLGLDENRLELTGNPPAGANDIDNIDGFASMGACGSLDDDGDGLPDVPIYFSVDEGTAEAHGVSAGDILVKPAGTETFHVYASAADLGLQPGDDIDALSVLDDNRKLVFDNGDGVVFSLRAGSPSLPIERDGISINAGGVFLSVPEEDTDEENPVTGLPEAFFSLSTTDDLDGIFVVDPRTETPPPGTQIGENITLIPVFDTNNVNTKHTVTATVTTDSGKPRQGVTVKFEIIAGPHAGLNGMGTTDAKGQITFTYLGTKEGTDTIVASYVKAGKIIESNKVQKEWVRPTVITLVSFTVEAGDYGKVTLRWETVTEVDNAGFNIYRAKLKDVTYERINNALIPAKGNTTTGATYSFVDTPGRGTYYYKLEDVDYYGVSTMHGPEKMRVRSGNNASQRSR